MQENKVIYGVFIKSTPEKVWAALTQSEFTRQYFPGSNVESDWKVGSQMRVFTDDGTTIMKAEIVESEPNKKLTMMCRLSAPDGSESEESKQTFDIEERGDVVKLIVTHEDPSASFGGAMDGWVKGMSSLKSLLETGAALRFD